MKKCITPAGVSILMGGVTALTLFGISISDDETTRSAATQYFMAIANIAAQNTVTVLATAGCVTTALIYTFIAKPIDTLRDKCTHQNEQDRELDRNLAYQQI